MYSGKTSRSVFTDAKGKTDDLLHVQSTTKCVLHHPGKHGGLCSQEKGFRLSKQAPYLSSLHHFLPLTSKVNSRNAKFKLGFAELLTFSAGLLLSTLMRRHKNAGSELDLNSMYSPIKWVFFSFISQPMGNEEKGNFSLKRICQHTKQRKEQQ